MVSENERSSLDDKAVLFRTDPGGNGQVVVIDAITHLGRSDTGEDHKARKTPRCFRDAKVSVRIEAGTEDKSSVSRNHALLYPPDKLYPNFTIVDLDSLNGTYINDHRIEPNLRIELHPDDIIGLGPVRFKLQRRTVKQDHYGLMVGHYGGNLRGTKNDVGKLSAEFKRRGFSIDTLLDDEATIVSILAKLDSLKGQVTKDSIFLFYFSGHGNREGDLLLSADSRNNLRAPTLLSALSQFRGRKLLILDGCYTSAFGDYNLPPRTRIIGTEGKAYEGGIATMTMEMSVLGGLLAGRLPSMGYCSRAIYNVLKNHPKRIDLDDLVEKVREDKRIKYRQGVVQSGDMTEIILGTRRHARE